MIESIKNYDDADLKVNRGRLKLNLQKEWTIDHRSSKLVECSQLFLPNEKETESEGPLYPHSKDPSEFRMVLVILKLSHVKPRETSSCRRFSESPVRIMINLELKPKNVFSYFGLC
jgi:hypothetical protein